MAARRRFGGRPKREPEPGERVHLGFRVTPQLKQRLEEAATANGRSQSQEAELRLEQSFNHQELLPQVLALAYGRQMAAVVLMLGELMKRVGDLGEQLSYARDTHERDAETKARLTGVRSRSGWLDIPYAFDQILKAVNLSLEALRPPGEVRLPNAALEKDPPGTPPEHKRTRVFSYFGENTADIFLGEAASGEPHSCEHALVIHEMLGPALVDRIKKFERHLASELQRYVKSLRQPDKAKDTK
jgi:hypothetical protein